MDTQARAKRLLKYVDKISGKDGVESLTARDVSRYKGPQGEANKSQQRLAKRALQKIDTNKPLELHEMGAMEAIVLTSERPVIDVVNGDFSVSDPAWEYLNDDAVSHKHITDALPHVGRVEVPNMPSTPYAGTGFVVGENLLMTNRHVAELFALGEGQQQLRFKPGQNAAIDFRRENREQASQLLRISSIKMIHPYWDMALLEVEGLTAGQGHLTLDPTPAGDKIGDKIAVIGYPAWDDRTEDQELMQRVFNNKFNIKRIQPGVLHEKVQIQSYGGLVEAVTHDASTLGGNSGSAVIDLETGFVTALHFAGDYLLQNYGVAAHDLGLDGRIVDAGVAFSDNVRSDPTPWARFWDSADAGEAVVSAGGSSVTVNAPGQSGTVSIPLTITVSVG